MKNIGNQKVDGRSALYANMYLLFIYLAYPFM